jgi:hypothetical protein
MKKWLFFGIFVATFVITSCNELMASEFTIRVSGTSGLKFSGSYMGVTAGGTSTSRSVDGIVPEEYSVEGTIVSCTFQKQSESGRLRVEIIKGGKVVSQSETSAAYGVVSAATQ